MNKYKCSRLENDRWGIFCGDRLLATIASYSEAKHMVRLLERRTIDFTPQNPVPESRVDPGFNQLLPLADVPKRSSRRSRKAVS
jgi:hypothetical protein